MKNLKLILGLSLAAGATMAAAQGIRATVDGDPVNFRDVEPRMMNGRVMVPLRGVFEKMGASVVWFPETQTVIARNADTEIRLPIGSDYAWVNGQRQQLDAPARLYMGRTMVPLRFTSEALDANVQWLSDSRTVEIRTTQAEEPPYGNTEPYTPPRNPRNRRNPNNPRETRMHSVTIPANTVLPFRLETSLKSNTATVGDRFTAVLDPEGSLNNYLELPAGTTIEGHVNTATAKSGNTPGVIGLTFERIRVPRGRTEAIEGALIGLDSKSIENDNGRLVAKSNARDDRLKYVGYGAGAGVLLSVLGEGKTLTNALIGGALGYLLGEIQRNNQKAQDVQLDVGTRFGVRLDQPLTIQVPNNG